jgi:hypothetical protein
VRQARQNQEESQSGLHHALGGWIGQCECASKTPHPAVTRVGAGPVTKPAAGDQSTMHRRIHQRHGVGQRKPAREVCNGPNRGRDAKSTPDGNLGNRNVAAAHDDPNEPRSAPCNGRRGLDRAARLDVETVKPASGGSGEDRRVRQTELCGVQPRYRCAGNLVPGVETATESAPARAKEVVLCQPVPPSFVEIERDGGQCERYERGSRHDRQS